MNLDAAPSPVLKYPGVRGSAPARPGHLSFDASATGFQIDPDPPIVSPQQAGTTGQGRNGKHSSGRAAVQHRRRRAGGATGL